MQHSNVEPTKLIDVEPGPSVQQVPHAKSTNVHESLGTPLLQDTKTPGLQSPALSSHTTRACFRALAVLLPWAAAALLGVNVASAAQAVRAMHAATVARPQTLPDFSLRLARIGDRCLGVVGVKAQSQVLLQACSASGAQQFLLLNDGTIRSRSDDNLCMTSVPGDKLVLAMCEQSQMQVFDVQPSGKLVLKAKPSECLNLLYGDVEAGVVGLNGCNGDLNEVFVYGGGPFLSPVLERELSKASTIAPVNTDPDQMQDNVKLACWFTLSMSVLSVLLIMAACPKRRYRCLYVMVLGSVAVVIYLLCSSLLSATQALQESERIADSAKSVASAQAADGDFTLRMTKSTEHCLGTESLKDKSKVGLYPCKASTVQQFLLKDDGTIRAKHADKFCMTVEQPSNNIALSPCDESKSHSQAFNKQAASHGWLQPQASPSMCLNLLGGDVTDGEIGLWNCADDLNEVFVYSGGNVAISGLALQVHKVRLLLKQASHHLEGDFVRILAPGGIACFLLLAVPSLVLLAGSAGPTSA